MPLLLYTILESIFLQPLQLLSLAAVRDGESEIYSSSFFFRFPFFWWPRGYSIRTICIKGLIEMMSKVFFSLCCKCRQQQQNMCVFGSCFLKRELDLRLGATISVWLVRVSTLYVSFRVPLLSFKFNLGNERLMKSQQHIPASQL